jgi:hypothetical protein
MAYRFLRCLTIAFVLSALGFTAIVLVRDIGTGALQEPTRSWISAMSLLFVGAAFLIAQPMMRVRAKELLKNILLAATFILWGIDQLMPQNRLSMRLGSLVVVLFVLDLAWVTMAGVNQSRLAAAARLAAHCLPTLPNDQSRDGQGLQQIGPREMRNAIECEACQSD